MRGGKRNGTQGKAYANRTDLTTPSQLPATAPTGQPYGAAGAQLSAQKTVPMANAPLSSAPQGQAPQSQGPLPGSMGSMFDPTQRPDEHLMTGVGQAPPVLAPDITASTLALLNTLGANVSDQVGQIRSYLALKSQNSLPQQ